MPVVFTSMLGTARCRDRSARRESFGATRTPQVWLDAQVMEDDGALIVTWDSVDALFPDGLSAGCSPPTRACSRRLADAGLWQQPLANWLAGEEKARRAAQRDRPADGRGAAARAVPAPGAGGARRGRRDRSRAHADLRRVADGMRWQSPAALGPGRGRSSGRCRPPPRAGSRSRPRSACCWRAARTSRSIPDWPAARRHHLLAAGEARVVLAVGASADWPADVRVIDDRPPGAGAAAEQCSGTPGRPARPRLRHLHLGFDRASRRA